MGKRDEEGQRYKLPVISQEVTIVTNILIYCIQYLKVGKRVGLKNSHHKKRNYNYMW